MAPLPYSVAADRAEASSRIQCPSSRPEMPGSAVFGVVLGSVEHPLVAYLEQTLPVTEELLALAGPVAPTEVFRFAAPCAGGACQHFDGTDCSLASRIVERLPSAVDSLPECAIRDSCRWWRQEGTEACFRCPLIATKSFGAADFAEALRTVADPTTPSRNHLPILR